ncbi:MAG: tRNA pseudouridine(55) synthase TruB [Ignavibacteria bacterium RBG_13_36_8]|nr:MAG: tRNA pseudouridine(55) synthase TruB [Ignavibacteria bacterium RBG_13_36_8]
MRMITKKTKDSGFNFNTGEVILVDKEKGFTSFDVIAKLRRILKIKKIGHAGTLDPLATGLLIICTGRKTKEIYHYQDLNKKYSGVITLGKSTPTMDSETDFIEEKNFDNVTTEKIFDVRDTFLGKISQIPPMYSAVKHKGKALYKYARKGIEIKREPKEVFISKFDILKTDLPDILFEIDCSKGTYIRVIADDFGKKLGCGAYLKNLRRERIGEYSVEDAFTIEEFTQFINSN